MAVALPAPAVRWLPEPIADRLPRVDPIDIRREAGLRLWAVGDHERTDLTVQLHHVACDALGTVRFLEELLCRYAGQIGIDGLPPLPPSRPEKLRRRGRFGLNAWQLFRTLGCQAVGLLGVWKFAVHRPAPLGAQVSPQAARALPAAYPATLTHRLTVEESAGLRRSAKASTVSLNDLLARDLFLAFEDWRAQHAPGRRHDWLRLTVPVSLRTPADGDMPVANVISMVFLDRRPADMADPGRLLQGIHAEMGQIKRFGLGLTFVLSLWAVRRLPGGVPRMARKAQCAATSLLSNLGPVLADVKLPRQGGRIVLGGAVLESIDAVGPLRPQTYTAFSVLSYAGQLGITLHYDPRAFTAAEGGAPAGGLCAAGTAVRREGVFPMTSLAVALFWLLALSIAAQAAMALRLFAALRKGRAAPAADAACPKAVVVLCLRGRDPFLDQCVRALLDQDYPRYDVRIVVDGPDDPAWRRCRRFRSGHGAGSSPSPSADRRAASSAAASCRSYRDWTPPTTWSPCWMPTPCRIAPGSASWSPRWPIRASGPPPATAGTCRPRRVGPAWSAICGTRPRSCRCTAMASPGAARWR